MCICCMQDLLQEELHEDDLEQVKQSAQGLGVEVRHNLHLPISCFNTLATGASSPSACCAVVDHVCSSPEWSQTHNGYASNAAAS